MTEGIHRQMDLGALAFLRAIKSRAVPTLRGALERPAIDDDRRRLSTMLLLNAAEQAQIVYGVLNAPCFEPSLRLAADHLCRWKIMWKKRPLRHCPAHPQQRIEHLPQRKFPLRGILCG